MTPKMINAIRWHIVCAAVCLPMCSVGNAWADTAPSGQSETQGPPIATAAVAPDTAPLEAVRGVVVPKSEISLSAEFSARIEKIPFDEGERFKRGQLLVRFDCTHYRAQTRAAWAAYRVHKQAHVANVELDKFQAVGKTDLQRSKAEMQRASAQARALEARMKQCKIVAPFDGVVVERTVKRHEVPSSNQPLLRIMNDAALELDLIIPSRWLRWLNVGTSFEFTVDETGDTHTAKVRRISAAVDPVSQTIKVSGSFKKRPPRVLPGMSGSAAFTPG
ncbi:MAG: efflux RND transporter periplasmic adaptor subunit [Gammaproteobacteria bacterium]|nr:efflux RND transporter periplasmic adaptor subunit [Gammaproteobacteria bacterium]